MLTDRDVCIAASAQENRPLSEISVADAMSKDVIACAPGDPLDRVEQLMGTRQIRRLPVVDRGRLVGILSLNDLALAALSPVRLRKREAPSATEVAETLAMICARRVPAMASQP